MPNTVSIETHQEQKDEQLENYRIAVGILIAVMAFYVALTVAI